MEAQKIRIMLKQKIKTNQERTVITKEKILQQKTNHIVENAIHTLCFAALGFL